MSVIPRIRAAIGSAHDEIETTPYAVAIMSGGITRSDYVVSIAQLHAIHAALESVVNEGPIAQFFDPEMIRTTALDRDLAYWQADRNEIALLPETESTVAAIHSAAANSPLSLIGMIYVMEGSRMGSLVIAGPLAKALGTTPVAGQGLDYHTEGSQSLRGRLGAWKQRVEQANFDESQIDAIQTAAVRLMDELNQLYQAFPVSGNRNRRGAQRKEAMLA
jgi:heme oxygenase